MTPIWTVLDAMIACGVDNEALFMGETQATRIAEDIFDNVFLSCMDTSFKELDDHFKTYSDLTGVQSQIRLRPETRKNVKAFVQWTRNEICLGRNPSSNPFPVNLVSDLIYRYKTHEKYQADSKMLAEAAKPERFKESMKWEDWKPTFLNYSIRAIPGQDGVPLKYVCRDEDNPDPTENEDFLDDYVSMAPLQGDSYAIDSDQVHTFLVNFVSGNDTAEAKIQGLQRLNNGREYCKVIETLHSFP
jgi:hypothetical protein